MASLVPRKDVTYYLVCVGDYLTFCGRTYKPPPQSRKHISYSKPRDNQCLKISLNKQGWPKT